VNVVSIMAHADDEMRCLGTMLRCAERGDRLAFITVTDGSHGYVQDPARPRADVAAIRRQEMAAVAADLAATFISLDEEDEFLYDTPAVRLALIEAIRATRAELIFTHFGEDYNLDHTIVSSLVRHCAMQACLPLLPTVSPPLSSHPAIFMVEPHGAFIFPATHYVDISGVEAEKRRLLAHHRSQEEAMRLAVNAGLGDLSARLSAFRGEQVGCAHAEAFAPMPARGAIKPFTVLP
jgi:LmbE family N-acetylglucosaminyl deacetylase